MNGYVYDCANMSDEELAAPIGMEWIIIFFLFGMSIFVVIKGTWQWAALLFIAAALMFLDAIYRQKKLELYYFNKRLKKARAYWKWLYPGKPVPDIVCTPPSYPKEFSDQYYEK